MAAILSRSQCDKYNRTKYFPDASRWYTQWSSSHISVVFVTHFSNLLWRISVVSIAHFTNFSSIHHALQWRGITHWSFIANFSGVHCAFRWYSSRIWVIFIAHFFSGPHQAFQWSSSSISVGLIAHQFRNWVVSREWSSSGPYFL